MGLQTCAVAKRVASELISEFPKEAAWLMSYDSLGTDLEVSSHLDEIRE